MLKPEVNILTCGERLSHDYPIPGSNSVVDDDDVVLSQLQHDFNLLELADDNFHAFYNRLTSFKTMTSTLPPLVQAFSGAMGSATANAVSYPLDVVTTRLQTTKSKKLRGFSDSDTL